MKVNRDLLWFSYTDYYLLVNVPENQKTCVENRPLINWVGFIWQLKGDSNWSKLSTIPFSGSTYCIKLQGRDEST